MSPRSRLVATGVAALLACASAARAQAPEEAPPPGAQPPTPTQTQPPPSPPQAGPPTGTPPPQPPQAGTAEQQPPRPQGELPASQQQSPPAAPQQPGQAARATAPVEEEDEEAAARALQRSLVQRGALLLPVWGAELVPELTYVQSGTSRVEIRTLEGVPISLEERSRTNQLGAALTARLGLPWELQVEGSLPLTHLWRDEVVVGTAERGDDDTLGVGDPRLSLTRQLLRTRGALPDLLLAAQWKMGFGRGPLDEDVTDDPGTSDALPLRSGFHGLGLTLTAVKAADPLVYLVNASYTANLPTDTRRGRFNPGDEWGASAGAVLAVSPDTSMSFLVDFRYRPELQLGGANVPGSNETLATLQLGLAATLSRRTLLNFALGAGLTDDAPDLQLSVSLPLRL